MDLPQRPGPVKRLVRNLHRRLVDAGYIIADRVDSTQGLTADAMETGWEGFKEEALAQDRRSVYDDMDEIDSTMPEGSRALDVLADNAVNSEGGGLKSFTISYETKTVGTKQKIIEDMVERLRLREKVYAIARDTAKYGDNFQQVVISELGRIERIMYMPPDSMRRNEDQFGLLKTGNEQGSWAFEQYDPGTEKFIAGFYPWQMIHSRWNRSGSHKYGTPQLASARYPWRKLVAMQEALVINWLTRAFVRLLFELDVTGKKPPEAKAYLKAFMQQLETRPTGNGLADRNVPSVTKDIAMGNSYINLNGKWEPSLNKVSVLDTSNSGFWNITGLEYWRNKFITATGVPKAHLGLEAEINAKSTLQWQDVRFARTVRRIQSLLSEFVAQLIDLELILHGIKPGSVRYKIEWISPSLLDNLENAQALNYIAQASESLLTLGVVDRQWLRLNALHQTPSEAEELERRIGDMPEPQDEPTPQQ
jgi:hypothetical protein